MTHGKLLSLVLAELERRSAFAVFRELRNAHVLAVSRTSAGIEVRSLWHPA